MSDQDFFSPMRQCQNADGRRKAQFSTMDRAERAAKRLGPGYRPYVCSFGHLHVGHPATFQTDEASA